MDTKHEQNGNKGSFYVEEGEQRLADMVYSMTPNGIMIIEHTEVSDVLRGKGVGYQLVEKAVEYAREHKIKIIPLCPFAKSVFDKKKDEYSDVLRAN